MYRNQSAATGGGVIPPPPPLMPIVHPLQDHCRVMGRGLIGLSDFTFEQIPVHRIVLCQSRKFKKYFTEHPDVKELDLRTILLFNPVELNNGSSSSCSRTGDHDCCEKEELINFDRSIIDLALDFVYGTDTAVGDDDAKIDSLFKCLLNLEFYSILPFVCKTIDSSVVNIGVYIKMYGELLKVSTIGRSGWDTTLLTEIQTIIESEITKKLITMSHQNVAHSSDGAIKEAIKNFEFVQLVALIEQVFCKNVNFSEMVHIICQWAEGNEERTNQSLGELLMICDQLRNERVPPPPPPTTIVQKPPPPPPRTVSSYSTPTHLQELITIATRPRPPPQSLLYGDDDSDYSDDSDW